jgi:hypothetical protein
MEITSFLILLIKFAYGYQFKVVNWEMNLVQPSSGHLEFYDAEPAKYCSYFPEEMRYTVRAARSGKTPKYCRLIYG